jgi:beta-mannosidase
MANTIDLNGAWEFKAVDAYRSLPAEYQKMTGWHSARVPGTVHTDLMALGIIPDPYDGTNENDVQWIDGVQWIYRKTFAFPESLRRETYIRLRAEGLDTYANIRINGKRVGRTSNMFVEHVLNLKNVLHVGQNTIEIQFDSPVVRSQALEQAHGRLRVALEPHRVYVRKAQYSFGWDWGPKLTTSGIWRPIQIEAFSGSRLRDPFVKVVSIGSREAVVRVSAELEGRVHRGTHVRFALEGGDWKGGRRVPVRGKKLTTTFRIQRPRLWWPNGHGDHPLYTAHLALYHADTPLHELCVRFALRKVRLLQEKDAGGKSFILEVNGQKIFCKGADWIPADNFIPRIPDSRYETLLSLARDAHMNMIRVWGGGIYENDIFYELCDRLGVMVWQDFMFACGEYPDQQWFIKEVKAEAEKALRRLRNHPSIVLWCGNNECEWLFCIENPGKKPDDMTGAMIFRDLLPSVCKSLDGTRPYWRSSPFGTGFPNDESNGVHHQWVVWSAWKDFAGYRDDNARFITEFGFQAPANLRTMESCTLPVDRHPQSPVIEHHNKQVEGTERLIRFMSGHFRLDMDFARFTYHGQLVQAEALKCAVEHWRRRKYRTAGALFWQLNDCWPVTSWAVIDSSLRPKAAYFYARRFFAPVLVSFRSVKGGVEVWVTSDLRMSVSGELTVSRRTFDGQVAWTERIPVRITRDSSRRVVIVDHQRLLSVRPDCEYLHAELPLDEFTIGGNRHFFAEPKHLNLPEPGLKAELSEEGDRGMFTLRIMSTALARNVVVEIEGDDAVFEDNYIDIDPGSTKNIRFHSAMPFGDVKKRVRFTWLK